MQPELVGGQDQPGADEGQAPEAKRQRSEQGGDKPKKPKKQLKLAEAVAKAPRQAGGQKPAEAGGQAPPPQQRAPVFTLPPGSSIAALAAAAGTPIRLAHSNALMHLALYAVQLAQPACRQRSDTVRHAAGQQAGRSAVASPPKRVPLPAAGLQASPAAAQQQQQQQQVAPSTCVLISPELRRAGWLARPHWGPLGNRACAEARLGCRCHLSSATSRPSPWQPRSPWQGPVPSLLTLQRGPATPRPPLRS